MRKIKALRSFKNPVFSTLTEIDRNKIMTRVIKLSRNGCQQIRSLRHLLQKKSHMRLHDVMTAIAQWHSLTYKSATVGQAMDRRVTWEAAMSKTFSAAGMAAIQLYVFDNLDDLFAVSEDLLATDKRFAEVFHYRCWFELARTICHYWGNENIQGAFLHELRKVTKFKVSSNKPRLTDRNPTSSEWRSSTSAKRG